MKTLFLSCIFFVTFVSAHSQNHSKVNAGIDVGSGYRNNSLAPSVLYHEAISIDKIRWLKFGLGIRSWGYFSGSTELRSKHGSNSLRYGHISVNGLSFVVGANVSFWKIDLGVDSDLGALAFGVNRNGFYEKNTSIPGIGEPYYNTSLSTSPITASGLPLFLKNQNGQSEAYLRIYLTEKIGLKFGYVHGRVAYLTRKVKGDKILMDERQRRVSATYGLPYLALTFPLSD